MYLCRVERDSIPSFKLNGFRKRAISFVIQFPRVVLAETVTHRMNQDLWGDPGVSSIYWTERTTPYDISKNSASSRAIPQARFMQRVKDDPYLPWWTLQQKGMQGQVTNDAQQIAEFDSIWLGARDDLIKRHEQLTKAGAHKQDCNRLLEPWAWVTQIVTSSSWDNFFALRCSSKAHPAFRQIARMMYLCKMQSTPLELGCGQWHLPFVPIEEQLSLYWDPSIGTPGSNNMPNLIKFSAARCAWLSYENHDKDGTADKMLSTFNSLTSESPVHASPVEHQLTPMTQFIMHIKPSWQSNVKGWVQARKLIPHEETLEYNPSASEIESWGIKDPHQFDPREGRLQTSESV